MEKHKEIGYELGNVYWHNLDGFKEIWDNNDTETKDNCVNTIGKLALELCKNEPIINKRLAENLKIRDEECTILIYNNIKLRKQRNTFRVGFFLIFFLFVLIILFENI